MRVTQAQADDGTLLGQTTTGFAVPYEREHAAVAANRVLLERLAAETGGPRLADAAASFSRETAHRRQPQPVWPYLIAGALVMFILDVAVRRFRLTPADVPLALRMAAGWLARLHWSRWRLPVPWLSPLRPSRPKHRP